jgi:hypothetical protein
MLPGIWQGMVACFYHKAQRLFADNIQATSNVSVCLFNFGAGERTGERGNGRILVDVIANRQR